MTATVENETSELDDEVLTEDPDEIVPTRRRRRIGPLTYVLLVVLVGLLSAYGGVRWQKSKGNESGTAAAAFRSFAASRGGGGSQGGGGSGGQGGAGAGAAAFGTVKLVDGTNVYVSAGNGNIVKVTTSADATTITRAASANVADLKPGETVVVQGATDADGVVSATRITDAGTGGDIGGAGGLGGGGVRAGASSG